MLNDVRCFECWRPSLQTIGLGWQCGDLKELSGFAPGLFYIQGAVASAGDNLREPAHSYQEQNHHHRHLSGQGLKAPYSLMTHGAYV